MPALVDKLRDNHFHRLTRLAHAEDLLSREGEGKRDIIANECGYAAWSSVHRLMGLRKQNAS